MRQIRKFARDRRGAAVIEYGLILALVFLVIVGTVHTLASHVISTWNAVSNNVASSNS